MNLGNIGLTPSNPTITDSSIIESQLRCIARGIPNLAQFDTAVQHRVEGLCIGNPGYFFTANENIQNTLFTDLLINYRNSVYTDVNNRFPGCNYDSIPFFQFRYQDCQFIIGVSIPEVDIVDKTKPFIVIPSQEFNTQANNYGYFLTALGGLGHIDSIIIDEDNIDNYYVWVVTPINLCDYYAASSALTEVCDGDNHCEEEYGETFLNCIDCRNGLSTNHKVTGTHDLYILDLQSRNDVNNKSSSTHPTNAYQESHLAGKYQIGCDYAIMDPTSSTTLAKPIKKVDWDNRKDQSGSTGRGTPLLWLADAWGNNAEIPRCVTKTSGSTNCNRGSQTLHPCNQLLFINYVPTLHDLYLVISESDLSGPRRIPFIHDVDASVPSNSDNSIKLYSQNTFAYTFNFIGGANTEIIKIPAPGLGSTATTNGWVSETRVIEGVPRTGLKKTFLLGGEMEVTLGFFS